jgi:hypothetical protein
MRDGERTLPLLLSTVLSTHPRNAHGSLNLDLWLIPECLVPILVGLRNTVELNQLLINAQQPARFHVSSPPCVLPVCVPAPMQSMNALALDSPCLAGPFSRRDRGPDHRTVISCRAISYRFVWSPVMLASCLISP